MTKTHTPMESAIFQAARMPCPLRSCAKQQKTPKIRLDPGVWANGIWGIFNGRQHVVITNRCSSRRFDSVAFFQSA
jgi:hypothetical protein